MTVSENDGGGLVPRFITSKTGGVGPNYDGIQVHLQTGIPFSEGSEIRATSSPGTEAYTFIGYIPSTARSGSVPAVSTWGFGIMLLLMLGIATLAFQKRANPAAGC